MLWWRMLREKVITKQQLLSTKPDISLTPCSSLKRALLLSSPVIPSFMQHRQNPLKRTRLRGFDSSSESYRLIDRNRSAIFSANF
jgi:hypothetical protein